MSNDEITVNPAPVESIRFPLLTTDRYIGVETTAKEAIKKRIPVPSPEQFEPDVPSRYSKRFINSVLGALAVTLIASFWISAGKQVAAAGLVFDPLPSEYTHLSEFWSQLSIIATLILSEIGAILFLVSAGTIAHSAPMTTLRGKSVNVTQLVLRVFAFACAGYAILSNVTITILHPQQSVAVVQWFISIVIPLIVLGLGVLLERIVIEGLRTGADRTKRYTQAMNEYRALVAYPDKNEHYPAVLFDAIYNELMKTQADRKKLGSWFEYVQGDQQYKVWLVQAEYHAHQQTNTLLPDGANPFLLPTTTGS